MSYDELLIEADDEGLIVKETPLRSDDGLCKGNRIAIRQNIPTLKKKADVLAEELGHYYTTVGDIIVQDSIEAQKQERRARLWGYNKRIGLLGIVEAYKAHCQNAFEIAEHLDVSVDSLQEALEYYRQIYGKGEMVDNYFIQFEPSLQVYELFMM